MLDFREASATDLHTAAVRAVGCRIMTAAALVDGTPSNMAVTGDMFGWMLTNPDTRAFPVVDCHSLNS